MAGPEVFEERLAAEIFYCGVELCLFDFLKSGRRLRPLELVREQNEPQALRKDLREDWRGDLGLRRARELRPAGEPVIEGAPDRVEGAIGRLSARGVAGRWCEAARDGRLQVRGCC
jgi:hypothetical protein